MRSIDRSGSQPDKIHPLKSDAASDEPRLEEVRGRWLLRGEGPSQLRVLVVEDNAADVGLIQASLAESRSLDFELAHVETVGAALEAIAADPPEVVLLDLGLPDASGLEALERISVAAPDLPILVLTGLDDERRALDAIRIGAQDFFAKGDLRGDILSRALLYAVERKRLERVEAFISGAAQVLGSSLSVPETIARLAQLSVDNLADFCVVDLFVDADRLQRIAIAHRDPGDGQLAAGLSRSPYRAAEPGLSRIAAAARRPVLVSEVTDGDLDSVARDEDHRAMLRTLPVRSYLAVPLIVADRAVGVLVLISSTRRLLPEDLVVAERFADIAAVAVDNARRFEESSEALRTRDRVLGVVAHDLRNPLSSISMSTEILLEGQLDELQTEKQLLLIRRATARMDRLIEDLLVIAKIEHGTLPLDLAYRDPAMLIQNVLEANQPTAAARQISLRANIRPTGPIVADAHRIEQVLTNLVDNALKFTPPGGEVIVGIVPETDRVRFFVTDNGPGIPSAELDSLFLPFWQGRERRGDGAGLGLSIAKGIAEGHGGRIWAESRPGHGTTLNVAIPLAEDRRGQTEPPAG